MATVLLLTEGTNGDVLPFVRIGRELAGRGHLVTLVTHAPYQATAAAAGLGFVPVDTDQAYARLQADNRRFLLGAAGNMAGLRQLYERNDLFGQWHRQVELITERYRPGDTVVVARHTSGLPALLAAERCGVPVAWIALSPSQPLTLPVTVHMYATVLGDAVTEVRSRLGLPPVTDWTSYLASARCQLGLWPDWFDAAGDPTPAAVEPCGFVLDDQAESGPLPAPVPELLAASVPPVLVTGGTGTVLSDEFYRVAALACQQAGVPALLVTRHRDQLPHPLPAGVHHVARAPFATLLPRLPAVIHHGGMGTLGRALSAQVRQLILAHGVDRPDNAARLAGAGIARWLPSARWQPDEVAQELAGVLADTGYRTRTAELVAGTDPAAAASAAATRIESLIGTDGAPDPHAFAPAPEPEPASGPAPASAGSPERRDPLAGLSPHQRRALAARLGTRQRSS